MVFKKIENQWKWPAHWQARVSTCADISIFIGWLVWQLLCYVFQQSSGFVFIEIMCFSPHILFSFFYKLQERTFPEVFFLMTVQSDFSGAIVSNCMVCF